MTKEEQKAADSFETTYVARAVRSGEGWTVECNRDRDLALAEEISTGLFITKERAGDELPEEILIGAEVRVYPGDLGAFHGVDIDGVEVFWLTPEEREAERKAWLENHEREQEERLERDQPKLSAEYEALPPAFKARIDRFRREAHEKDGDEGVAEFDRGSWAYEQFCCTEAAKLADVLRPYLAENSANRVFEWFHDLPYEEQIALSGMSPEHSGNTWGGAVTLAYHYLVRPEGVFARGETSELPGPLPTAGADGDPPVKPGFVVAVTDDELVGMTPGERAWAIHVARLVYGHTYSLQQSDFANAGFEVLKNPWRVLLPEGTTVIAIGTEDRYGIFREDTRVVRFTDVDAWRESAFHPDKLRTEVVQAVDRAT